MKKFFITLAVSTVLILGIWIVPNLINYNKTKQYSELEQVHQQHLEESFKSMEADSSTYINEDSIIQYYTHYEELQEQIVTASANQSFDWQAFITWVIGSLNGVFGLIVMAKKVFGKK